jgi:hypothetical protein
VKICVTINTCFMVCNITKECEIIVYFNIIIVGIKVFLGTAKLVNFLIVISNTLSSSVQVDNGGHLI